MKASRGSGDRGKTSLFSGERVAKSDARIEACGDVDELNSALGALASSLPEGNSDLAGFIKRLQSTLLVAGGWLGTASSSRSAGALDRITDEDIAALESETDRVNEDLPKLGGFILPGGHISASWAHLARTICRRAERRVVGLIESSSEAEAQDELQGVVVYLNRLSDYLFCLARHCNRITGTDEELWEK